MSVGSYSRCVGIPTGRRMRQRRKTGERQNTEFKAAATIPGTLQKMDNVATYSEARSEYTKQLATFVVPAMVAWFQTLWSRNASDKSRSMALFQNECEEIPRWNTDRVQDEVRALIERTGCDYMEELMTAVFIAHTKILTAVRLSKKKQELSITVPKLDHFVHRIFREAARSFWKVPFLFQDGGGVVERQKNILQIEALTAEAITTAVRSLLPVKEILNRYLEADTEEVEDETEAVVVAPAASSATPAASSSTPAAATASSTTASSASATPAAPAAPAAAETTPDTVAKTDTTNEKPIAPPPAVVNIDTETAVHFSDYDDVFQEGKSGPHIEYNPKDGDNDDIESIDGALDIDEASAKPLAEDDVEDLEAPKPVIPTPPVKTRPAVTKPIRDVIETDEVEVLE